LDWEKKWNFVLTLSVPALTDGDTLFQQADFCTEKDSPRIGPHAVPDIYRSKV
jgi:hypothetical protein